MLPTLFVSHGAPTLPLSRSPARAFLAGLAAQLGRPRAIVVASAHWETAEPAIGAAAHPETIHDFHGFPDALYRLAYPAPGDPELARRIQALLAEAGVAARLDPRQGLDHGAWVPLLLAYPAADIPVLQLSLQTRLGPAHHLRLGEALATLREDGVLVLGSGSWTHDLRRFRGQPEDAPAAPDVTAFADWMDRAVQEGRVAGLLDYRAQAPFAAQNHPAEEHLLPLFVALGAAGSGAPARRLHASAMFTMLRMDAYAFG